MRMRETDKTWELRQRPGFFLAVGVFQLLLFLVTLPLAIVLAPHLVTQSHLIDWRDTFVALFFAGCGAIVFYHGFLALKRGVAGRAVVMRIDPKGFWHQVCNRGQVIAWPVVEDVYIGGGLYTRGTRVRVDQATFKALYPRKRDRIFNAVSWLEFRPVFPIPTGGLEMRPRQIHDLMKSYAIAHGGLRKAR